MRVWPIAILAMMAILPFGASAQGFLLGPVDAGSLCRAAMRNAERVSGGTIPESLLAAIGRVESGRRNAQTGRMGPWPWTINAEGAGSFFETKAEAIAAVSGLQARGVRSIDVGCMQINLMHHPKAFGSLEQAFDPQANANYAARFLTQLHDQTGDWVRAAGMYHSATPDLAAGYQRLVMAAWPQERQEGGTTAGGPAMMTQLARAWRSTMPAGPGGISGGFFAPPPRSGDPPTGRIIPLAQNGMGGGMQGRGLDAYRAAPVAMAARPFRSPGG